MLPTSFWPRLLCRPVRCVLLVKVCKILVVLLRESFRIYLDMLRYGLTPMISLKIFTVLSLLTAALSSALAIDEQTMKAYVPSSFVMLIMMIFYAISLGWEIQILDSWPSNAAKHEPSLIQNILGCVVPVVNLFFPFIKLFKFLKYREGGGRKNLIRNVKITQLLIVLWWASWLFSWAMLPQDSSVSGDVRLQSAVVVAAMLGLFSIRQVANLLSVCDLSSGEQRSLSRDSD